MGRMDKRFLTDCLAQGMSLPQIGELVGRPPATVGYWVAKYGLVANGKERFSPGKGERVTRKALEPLVMEGLTIARIAEELRVGANCVRYWIAEYGLPRPHQVRQATKAEALRSGRTQAIRTCAKHGPTEFRLDRRGTWRCSRCGGERVSRRRRKVKRILVEEAGGSCCLCGYDRLHAALHFHHLDPRAKRFALSRNGYTVTLEKARAEAAKCVLLCANCHAEVEAGLRQVSRPG